MAVRPELKLARLTAEMEQMKPRSKRMLLPLLALVALASLAPSATAARGKVSGPGSLLFVQQTQGGSLRQLGSGNFKLELTGVSPRVSTFTDRPRRHAGSQRLRDFVSGWSKAGFAADPPNAALVLDHGPRSRDLALVTLSHPRYDRRQKTLTYRIRPLHGKDLGALAAFAKRADPVRAGNFGSASLFVDNGAGEVGYADINVTVNNATPGQLFQLTVSPVGGRAGWAIPSSRGLIGPELSTAQPGLPLTRFFASAGAIVLETAPEGSPFNFVLDATVEYEGTETATLTVNGAPGANIVVSYPTNQGIEYQTMSPDDPLEITLF